MFSSTGQTWLGIASRPIVAITAESASSSGIPAATSAPKAISEDDDRDRQREQAGTLEVLVELLVDLLLRADAELVDRQRRMGGGRSASTASITGSILSTASSASPRMSKLDDRRMAVGRDLPGVGGRVRALDARDRPRRAETRRTTSSTAARKAGSSARASCSRRAPSRRRAARTPRRGSGPPGRTRRGRVSLSSSCFVPIAPPITTAATTNASHPKIAVFRWRALQRPIRAAMLVLGFKGDIAWSLLFRG